MTIYNLNELNLANPNHPQTKKYLQDLSDAMWIGLVTDIEFCKALNELIAIERIDALFKQIEANDKRAATEEAYLGKLRELTAVTSSPNVTKEMLQAKANE